MQHHDLITYMVIFDFSDYKKYCRERIRTMPHRGRGVLRKLAINLKVHSTRLSQILNGSADLSPEQALRVSRFFGLSELETEYFLLLVQIDRAGTEELRKHLIHQLERVSAQQKSVLAVVPHEKALDENSRAIFYSSWHYSAVRLLTSIPEFQNQDRIADHLQIPKIRVRQILDFLISVGLCLEKNGRPVMGPSSTHLEASSPLISRHHSNWRLKALEVHDDLASEELAYSGPMSISKRDQEEIRAILLEAIRKATHRAVASSPEKLCCLNIDWFQVRP